MCIWINKIIIKIHHHKICIFIEFVENYSSIKFKEVEIDVENRLITFVQNYKIEIEVTGVWSKIKLNALYAKIDVDSRWIQEQMWE